MPNFISMVANMSEETFSEVIQASPRKIRETLFNRLGIKAKKKSVGLKVHAKLEARTKKLHARLKEADSKAEGELCEELLRNWLYGKRDLLCDALDHLGIEHDNGLIDEEPSQHFGALEKEKVADLVAHLEGRGHHREAIATYLGFVETPHLDEVIAEAA